MKGRYAYVARDEKTGRYRKLPRGWKPGMRRPRGVAIRRVLRSAG